MQCTGYLPGYHYPKDLNAGFSGDSWSIPHNDTPWNSGIGFNFTLPPFIVDQDQDLVHQKDILKQTILKHEATFRYQVNELHRIYSRQKELMGEIKRRKLAEEQLHLQALESKPFVSQSRSETSQKTQWPLVNLTSIEPSAPSTVMFQESYNPIAGKDVQPGADCFSEKYVSKECKVSSSKSNTSRKRMFDLELPAEEYLDTEEWEGFEEGNPAIGPNIPISQLQPQCDSKFNFATPGDSSISHSRCHGNFLLFDLNEPIQNDDSGCPISARESDNIYCDDVRDMDQDSFGKAHTVSTKEGRDGSNLNAFDEASSVGRTLLPCNQTANLHQKIADKCHYETKTNKSLPVSSWGKFKEIPFAVQALPCFNNDSSFSKSAKSSVENSSLTGKKLNLHKSTTSSPASGNSSSYLMQCGDTDSAYGHTAAVKYSKVSDSEKSVQGVDLNLTPPSYMAYNQFSTPTSSISHLNPPEGRDSEIREKSGVLDSGLVPCSTLESRKCTRDIHLVGAEIDNKRSTTSACFDLNSCIQEEYLPSSTSESTKSTVERDLEAPVSPENKECSPPRGDSQDNLISKSVQLSSRDPSHTEELDRVAADTLVFISSTMVQKYSKTAISDPSEASSDCLGLLAEIATSLASNPHDGVEQLMKVSSDGINCSEALKLKIREGSIDDYHHQLKVAKEKGAVGITLPSQPRKRRARRTKDHPDIQKEMLPNANSLSLHPVNEDLKAIRGLISATNTASETGARKKTRSRTSSKVRRESNVAERGVCSNLLQHTCDSKQGIFLKGWGVTKGRQRTRTARSYI